MSPVRWGQFPASKQHIGSFKPNPCWWYSSCWWSHQECPCHWWHQTPCDTSCWLPSVMPDYPGDSCWNRAWRKRSSTLKVASVLLGDPCNFCLSTNLQVLCVMSLTLWSDDSAADGRSSRRSCHPRPAPFTSTGVDYFRPIQVKRGRSLVKRYGAIFTCSESGAVHIGMAASLDTVAFLNALRRFTACRGHVKIIRSDNGTNIVRAQRELRQAIQGWDSSHIQSHLPQKEIDWRSNSPGALTPWRILGVPNL